MDPHAIKLVLIVALPLAAAMCGFVLQRHGQLVGRLGLVTLLASAGMAIALLASPAKDPERPDSPPAHNFSASTPWISMPESQRVLYGQAPTLEIPLALRVDLPRLLFALTTSLIGALCLLFSLRDRRDDPRRGYFYSTLTLFTTAMLLFVCADTLLLAYLAWELMGLCSFLLIGYPATTRARRAAREAFWTTRATDFGLLFAVITLMGRFGWTTFSQIHVNDKLAEAMQLDAQYPGLDMLHRTVAWLGTVAILALLATLGKAAQWPLSFWLAESMVAPTPVTALLHAATMVAAGPFLLTQLAPFFQYSQPAMLAAVALGGLTLVLGGLMALAAHDAKRVLAYSTVSQLGLAVIGCGVLAEHASLAQLLTHAWFKAPLFLVVGYLAAVTPRHAHDKDEPADAHGSSTALPYLAGSARHSPLARWTLVLAGLSLAGVPFLAGAISKDQILLALSLRARQVIGEGGPAFSQEYPLAAAGWLIGAMLVALSIPITAAYTARLVGVLGWGKAGGTGAPARDIPSATSEPATDEGVRATNSGWQVPILATLFAALIGSVGLILLEKTWAGWIAGQGMPAWKWDDSGPAHTIVMVTSFVAILIAGWFAWRFNVASTAEGRRAVEEGGMAPLIRFFADGMRLREFWLAVVGHGGALLAWRADRIDRRVVDRAVDATARDGRKLAVASRWIDEHVVDGARYWACELWWLIRRAHQRLLQTGYIQHYMFVILISAVILCFVALRPLARAFGQILGRM